MMLVLAITLLGLLTNDSSDRTARTFGEHAGEIMQLAVSEDGAVVVSAAKGEILAWDPVEGRQLWKHSLPPSAPVAALAIGGKLVVQHPGIAALYFLDLATGEHRGGLGGTTATQKSRCLVVDPRERWVWVGTEIGVLTRLVPDQVHAYSNRNLENGGVRALALDSGGKLLLAGGVDGTVRFVNPQSAQVDGKKVARVHEQAVTAVLLDPKATLGISASEAGDIRTFRVSNARLAATLKESGPAIQYMALDPKGELLAAGDAEGRVEVWDLRKRELRETLEPAGSGAVSGLVFAGKGRLLVASRAGTQMTAWDLSDL